jgi:hypothetical protein
MPVHEKCAWVESAVAQLQTALQTAENLRRAWLIEAACLGDVEVTSAPPERHQSRPQSATGGEDLLRRFVQKFEKPSVRTAVLAAIYCLGEQEPAEIGQALRRVGFSLPDEHADRIRTAIWRERNEFDGHLAEHDESTGRARFKDEDARRKWAKRVRMDRVQSEGATMK